MSNDQNINDDYKDIVESQESQDSSDLGKVNMERFKTQKAQDADMVLGYHEINITHLPSAGMFYPTDIQLSIRSAKVAEIRHFSSIDEQNVFDVDDKLNYILENCIRVTSSKKRLSYKDLCEEDRFFVILSVRDLTFPEPENKLSVDHTDKKGKKQTIEIKKEYFDYFKIPETLDKYYDNEEKSFKIETKSLSIIML